MKYSFVKLLKQKVHNFLLQLAIRTHVPRMPHVYYKEGRLSATVNQGFTAKRAVCKQEMHLSVANMNHLQTSVATA